ncbi:MAG: UDP-3-O-(3-hydroxymyristoyl)glucosamine N-acyltransferase [Magnetococcales bacterium]|nr:UDP-3-O-(3-hydroxymyristoyl)glucosamine N-acyltransferase [Magnetococcales bacterium]
MKLTELAQQLDLPHRGADVDIHGIAPLENASATDLSFAEDRRWLKQPCHAAALIVPQSLVEHAVHWPCLVSDQPALDVGRAGLLLGLRPMQVAAGVHPTAVIDETAQIGDGVAIGPRVVIGSQVVIGADTIIHAGAIVHERCEIGSRCIIHSNAVIGADGYGFQFVAGQHQRIPHFGTVVIGDDVEVGAGTTIDRGRFGATRIGTGSKVDNLVQIGHNVQIGRHVLIVAQVGIAGSCRIEDGAILAGQAGIAPHMTVGKGSRVAASTGVATEVPAGKTWSGWWGQEHRRNLIEMSALRKLPEFMKRVEAFLSRWDHP